MLIEPVYQDISILRQCELLDLSRSSYYYRPATATPEDIQLMRLIDAIYTDYPFYGKRRITKTLNGLNFDVNVKRVHRLMQVMGLEAIYPKPNLSQALKDHTIYPYLLRLLTLRIFECRMAFCIWSLLSIGLAAMLLPGDYQIP